VSSILGHGSSYEVDLTEKMLPNLMPDDLLIFDRGYASYSFMAKLIAENKQLKINKAVSFNAIKNMAFDIFFTEPDKSVILDQLTKLFSMNSVIVREDRQVPRKKISDTQSLNFQKRMRKHVF